MLKKTISFTDYNGNSRTEDFYFNLTKAELLEMEADTVGGMAQTVNDIVMTQNTRQAYEFIKELILRSYGVKSADGRRFIKSEEIRDEFSQTEAYSELFMELAATDEKALLVFLDGVIPTIPSNAENAPALQLVPETK